ncbi:MAG: hypothetical protein ABJZ55_23815 [Fuerstiella sp.]
MSIERAEALKKELTDQWVRVASPAPELKRFADCVGLVKTVNMNCQALVEFHGDKDVSWYDIAPEYLTITDKPEEKPAAKTRRSAKPSAAKISNSVSQSGVPAAEEPKSNSSSSQSSSAAIRSDSQQHKD